MTWVVRLAKIGIDGEEQWVDVAQIVRSGLGDIANLGLTMAEGKLVLTGLQKAFVAGQAREHAVLCRPDCRSCGAVCRVKDYRKHRVATLFGRASVRLARFNCARCGVIEAGNGWPPHCQSTPELDLYQAHLSALMPYWEAAGMLVQMLPLDAGKCHETLRRHTLRTGEALRNKARLKLGTAAPAIDTSLDSTFIRSCKEGERHLEVIVGNVETAAGARRVFGAVAKSGTDIREQIRGSLDALGRTADTRLTGFTDGCSGLRRILADVGVTETPILDWFHIAMRLQHLKQIVDGLPADGSERAAAKAVIVEEIDRLKWRLWNGKAKDAQISIDRIEASMPPFQVEADGQKSIAPSKKLSTAARAG